MKLCILLLLASTFPFTPSIAQEETWTIQIKPPGDMNLPELNEFNGAMRACMQELVNIPPSDDRQKSFEQCVMARIKDTLPRIVIAPLTKESEGKTAGSP